jgi:N-carbamoyl-L-amino-acid hydrolase
VTLEVDERRLSEEIEALARISDAPYPAVTRVLFTATDLRARAHLAERLRAAGLEVREDAIGNAFARWPGADPALPPIATGSHVDAIPEAGRFDGVVGVLGALEAIRALRGEGFRPRRSIELIVFTAEEPTRFGIGCLGSRMLAGNLSAERLAALRDADGRGLDDVRAEAGYVGALEGARLPRGAYSAFVELHIEQGPELEGAGVPIGVVTAIAAPATLRVVLSGEGGHAGAVLMPDRHDPLLAASEVALAAERAALRTGRPDTVATVGLLEVEPGAVNSIARRVHLQVDVRDTDLEARDGALDEVWDAARRAAERRGVGLAEEVLNADPPAACDPGVVAAIERAAADAGAAFRRMVSRAYHDALFMARVCPTGMIFVPSVGGASHRPDEYTRPEDVARGARVLAETLRALAGPAPGSGVRVR